MFRIDAEEARRLAERVLAQQGAPAAHAHVQADLLIEAELRGYASHGLLRLPRIVERIRHGVVDPRTRGSCRWIRRNHLDVDGCRGLGPVVALAALDTASERARTEGVAVACVRNNNHLGMLAWYAEYAARQGLVLIALTTSEALVHPWGGRKAMLGTNPVAIGVPAMPAPLVLDMATSLVSMGKVHDHANRGLALQSGWALDAQGNPTIDAQAAKSGALSPFGGAKGYALGLAIEVLVTCLTGSAIGTDIQGTLDSTQVCNKGDVFILLAPQHGERIHALVSAYLEDIRTSPPATPGEPVAVPGDRARQRKDRALAEGLPLDDVLWRQLCGLDNAPAPSQLQETSP